MKLLGIDNAIVKMRGLDALDGAPVLDLKRYMPTFDRVEEVCMPSRVACSIEAYF